MLSYAILWNPMESYAFLCIPIGYSRFYGFLWKSYLTFCTPADYYYSTSRFGEKVLKIINIPGEKGLEVVIVIS